MASFLDDCRNVCDEIRTRKISFTDENIPEMMRHLAELENYYKRIFILLSKAVISGEYVFDEKYLSKLNTFLSDFSVEAGYDSIGAMQANFNSWIKESLNYYINFVSNVRNKSDNTSLNLLFSVFRTDGNISNDYVRIFVSIVVRLAHIDHFLSYNKKTVIELALIQEELSEKIKIDEENEEHVIYSILLDKCNFLLRKLLHKSSETDYAISSELKTINFGDIKKNKLNDLFLKFEYLYLFNNYKSYSKNKQGINIEQYQEDCNGKEQTSQSYKYVILVKHYQQEINSIEQMDNLIEIYDKYCENNRTVSNIDKYAQSTIKNYLYNSRLSFKMDLHEYDISTLKIDLKTIENIQLRTRIDNYYPYYKSLLFLGTKIDACLKDKDCNISILNEMVEYYNHLLEKFKSKFEICKKLNYYPFQIENKSCIVKCKDVNIFIVSSFARPIDYSKLEHKLSEFKLKSSLLGYQLDLVQKVNDISSVKKIVEDSNKRNFEYLGIFVAIITFLFASVQEFNVEGADIKYSSLRMISLGLVLCFFVVLLKIFNSMSIRWTIASFAVFVVLLIILICQL